MDLIVAFFPFFVAVFLMGAAWAVVKLVVRCIAARFGWRPKIYKKELVSLVAKDCSEQYCVGQIAVHEAMGEEITDDDKNEMRKEMARYSAWVIEQYTLRYALAKG
jgi:hypothetical protein